MACNSQSAIKFMVLLLVLLVLVVREYGYKIILCYRYMYLVLILEYIMYLAYETVLVTTRYSTVYMIQYW